MKNQVLSQLGLADIIGGREVRNGLIVVYDPRYDPNDLGNQFYIDISDKDEIRIDAYGDIFKEHHLGYVCATILKDHTQYNVTHFHVADDDQDKHVGSILLKVLTDILRNKKQAEIYIQPFPELDSSLNKEMMDVDTICRIYEQLGFKYVNSIHEDIADREMVLNLTEKEE